MKTINIEDIQGYIEWRREKDMYPPQWTPQEYAQELLMEYALEDMSIVVSILNEYKKGAMSGEETVSQLLLELDLEDDIG